MTTAIFGLLGVTVGAVIAGAFGIYTDHRQQKRLLRTARRLLRLELKEACSLLDASTNTWIAEPSRVLSNDQWIEHRSVWGANAGEEAWDAVSSAFLAVAELRRANLDREAGDASAAESFVVPRAAIDRALEHLVTSKLAVFLPRRL